MSDEPRVVHLGVGRYQIGASDADRPPAIHLYEDAHGERIVQTPALSLAFHNLAVDGFIRALYVMRGRFPMGIREKM